MNLEMILKTFSRDTVVLFYSEMLERDCHADFANFFLKVKKCVRLSGNRDVIQI